MKNDVCGIYKITNKINGQCYIGLSIHIYERWNQHLKNATDMTKKNSIYKAFREFGIKNFDFSILEECQKEELPAREIYWIAYYNSYYNGYNETKGGDGTAGEGGKSVRQYDMQGNFIAEYESITQARIETGITSISGACNDLHKTAGGYQWRFSEEENRDNIGSAMNPDDYCKIPVLQYDLEGNFLRKFGGINEAARLTSSDASCIVRVCKKEISQANGYQWKYKNDDSRIFPLKEVKFHYRKVAQYDKEGNFINIFNSISEAERENGWKVKSTNITKVCKGEAYESKGYQWRYVIDNNYTKNIGKSILKEKYIQDNQNAKKQTKKVQQCDLETHKVIKEFNSMTEASKETGICLSSISETCNGKKKSAGGYYWLKI